ncbi:ankyrin repeat-containing protein At5g02620-like [Salvia hispanica]|uniref:ankyrin repeat-containing protein At5g02620-like n=1 Tax=Salvia hispanica TaxID=49212 RepID=UPI00200910A5|nr:ankyrin repeat-containing protein At5g02620-like [Salvia hispanica]
MEETLIKSDEKKLYDAAIEGNASLFQKLLQKNPFLLNKISFSSTHKSPLHIATYERNLNIVQQIMDKSPELAEELDSQKSSPLHIAAAKGYVEIASILLAQAPNMCWSRDCRGMNPIHVAAMNGRVDVVERLVEEDGFAAMEKLDRGETVLHLCVKHRQLGALRVLVDKLGEFVCEEDDAGDTVLHLAVRFRQVEMIQYLVENTIINKKSKNSNTNQSSQSPPVEWLTKKRDSIMVVAILIATMAFQAAVSPAGGVWQDDTPPHRAGEAVMAYNNPKIYKNFIRSNTVAFVTSLSTILLLISGLPFKYRFFMWALMAIMWVSVTAVGVTYGASIMVVTPGFDRRSLSQVIKTGISVWSGVMVVLLAGNIIRLLLRWLRRVGVGFWMSERCFRKSGEV